MPFEVPAGADLVARMPSIFEVLYLIFNEGYAAAAGDAWMRPALCQDAMRLGRILAAHVPDEAEAHGLVALMELQASRMRARTDARGNPILLLDQNRARWDHALIQHGLAALGRAMALRQPLGVYTLQAAIAGCHARAREAAQTDWPRIVALYDALVELTQSPVVELNRAMAVGMARRGRGRRWPSRLPTTCGRRPAGPPPAQAAGTWNLALPKSAAKAGPDR